jgi:16S rRNA G966 N2-methylase RsmD
MSSLNIDDKEAILKYIDENQRKSTQKNRNTFGEVFTPAILINEILDNLPPHIWKIPEYRWLDPCAGSGNFFLLVYVRLMESLKSVLPDPHQRKKHILKNMLYMNDFNRANVASLKTTFGEMANIYHGDFLKEGGVPQLSGAIKYNVILENPPYQISKKGVYKGGRGVNHTLWNRFIEKSVECMEEDNGWLGAITPSNWRSPNNQLYDTVASRLSYLHIYSKKDGIRLFGAQTRFDLYVLNSKKHDNPPGKVNTPPLIIDEHGERHSDIQPVEWVFLPNHSYNKVKRFFQLEKGAKKRRHTSKLLYDSNEYNSKNLSKRKTARAIYPVVHTITRKGLGVRWSSKKKGHFGTPKVLLNRNEKQYPYNDWKGEYGMSQLTFGILVDSKKEGDMLVEKINQPDFKEAIVATKWGSFQTDPKMFAYLR